MSKLLSLLLVGFLCTSSVAVLASRSEEKIENPAEAQAEAESVNSNVETVALWEEPEAGTAATEESVHKESETTREAVEQPDAELGAVSESLPLSETEETATGTTKLAVNGTYPGNEYGPLNDFD